MVYLLCFFVNFYKPAGFYEKNLIWYILEKYNWTCTDEVEVSETLFKSWKNSNIFNMNISFVFTKNSDLLCHYILWISYSFSHEIAVGNIYHFWIYRFLCIIIKTHLLRKSYFGKTILTRNNWYDMCTNSIELSTVI